MNFSSVAADIRTALATVDGLRLPPYGDRRALPPFAFVAFPESISYDATYGRGKDAWDIQIGVVCGRPDGRPVADLAGEYASGAGDLSIKKAIESGTYTACDRPRVVSCSPDFGGIWDGQPNLILTFLCKIVGPGST